MKTVAESFLEVIKSFEIGCEKIGDTPTIELLKERLVEIIQNEKDK